jgi:signal transduction histidine kinase
MKLLYKSIALQLAISVVTMIFVLKVVDTRMRSEVHRSIQSEIVGNLEHIDHYLVEFFQHLEADLETLIAHPIVRTRKEEQFTSFLDANPDTFEYQYSPEEKEIIRILNDYRIHHAFVSSVYMGRENGAFVRSHPRAKPTAYDPRERPWYQLALRHPGQIVYTSPYSSVTTTDINIGVVKALLDEEGQPFGVIGMDVTLNRLTDYLADFQFQPDGQLMLLDSEQTILVAKDRHLLYTSLRDFSPEAVDFIQTGDFSSQLLNIGGELYRIVSLPIEKMGWTALVLVPEEAVAGVVNHSLMAVMVGLSVGLVLFLLFSMTGLYRFVIQPIRTFTRMAIHITETQELDDRVEVTSRDEVGELANAWNNMTLSLKKTRDDLALSQHALMMHRDQLEGEVKARTADLLVEKERAEASDRLKSAFLATMSHELRTPLNSIIGFTGILLKGLVGELNAEQIKQLTMVKSSANHLLALINDVLDISKIEAGELKVVAEPFELKQVMDKSVLEASPLAEKKGLQLITLLDDELPDMRGDARRLEQILLNLLSNAIKFTESGSVTLACRWEDEKNLVRIEVSDTGIGIKKEDLDCLFRPFRQIDTGLSRKYEGTGLGLSISQKLVTMMGGEIWVESRWGQGSVFAFTLPVIRKELV